MLDVAVVGMGWWGKTLVTLMSKSSKLRVVKGMKRSPASEIDFAREHGFEMVSDYAQVLNDPQVKAVVLCTPHTAHTGQIIAAANAGKHVFCEKPLSLTRADAERALAAINANKVQIAIGHERRFEPPIVDLMRTIQSGELGVPLQIEANFSQDKFLALPAGNWRLKPEEAPAGPITATGIHILDLSISVFGAAESVWCSVKQLGSSLTNTRYAVRRALCGVLQQGLDRSARQGASEHATRLDAHQSGDGRQTQYGRISAVVQRTGQRRSVRRCRCRTHALSDATRSNACQHCGTRGDHRVGAHWREDNGNVSTCF